MKDIASQIKAGDCAHAAARFWVCSCFRDYFPNIFSNTPPLFIKNGTKTNEIIAMSLMRMFSEGPLVSLKGSPTVSPTTAA